MREVYNGYEEKYMTGKEIREYFSDAYLRWGRHHERISAYKMDLSTYKRLKDDVEYRVFINDCFCAIFDKEKDTKQYFIAYTKQKPKWAKD